MGPPELWRVQLPNQPASRPALVLELLPSLLHRLARRLGGARRLVGRGLGPALGLLPGLPGRVPRRITGVLNLALDRVRHDSPPVKCAPRPAERPGAVDE